MKSLRTLVATALVGVVALASNAFGAVKGLAQDLRAGLSDAAAGFVRAAGIAAGLVTLADSYTGKYPIRLQPTDSSINEVAIPFALPAANPANGDILAICKIPPGVKIVDWAVAMEDADSNGAPAIAFSFGSLNSASAPTGLTTTFKSGITIGQAGGVQRMDSTAAYTESAAAERPVGLLFTAAAATYVAGKTGVLTLALADA